jgi:iron(III) transport system ATP-binding protein
VSEFLSDAWLVEMGDAAARAPGAAGLDPLAVDVVVTGVPGRGEVTYHLVLRADGVSIAAGPATAADAAFVCSCNFLLGTVEQTRGDHVDVRLQATGTVVSVAAGADWLPGAPVTVAVRPEKLTIRTEEPGSRDLNILDTEVVTKAYVGSRYEYILRLGDIAVQVVSPDGSLGGAVRLVFSPDDAHVYPGESGPSTEALDLMKVAV